MPKIIFKTSSGRSIEVDGEVGETVMLAAMLGDVAGITADCGGGCSCGTCLVSVDADWCDRLAPPADMEAGMLESMDGINPRSRLSCQLPIDNTIDGLIVHVDGE
jgi:2Fe-2S ferredoxin